MTLHPLPAAVQPHMLAHDQAMQRFYIHLEQGGSRQEVARALIDAAASLSEAGKTLMRQAEQLVGAAPPCPVAGCRAGMLGIGADQVSCPVCEGTITREAYLESFRAVSRLEEEILRHG